MSMMCCFDCSFNASMMSSNSGLRGGSMPWLSHITHCQTLPTTDMMRPTNLLYAIQDAILYGT